MGDVNRWLQRLEVEKCVLWILFHISEALRPWALLLLMQSQGYSRILFTFLGQ